MAKAAAGARGRPDVVRDLECDAGPRILDPGRGTLGTKFMRRGQCAFCVTALSGRQDFKRSLRARNPPEMQPPQSILQSWACLSSGGGLEAAVQAVRFDNTMFGLRPDLPPRPGSGVGGRRRMWLIRVAFVKCTSLLRSAPAFEARLDRDARFLCAGACQLLAPPPQGRLTCRQVSLGCPR